MSDGLILEYICSLVTLETIGRKLLLILLCFDWVLNIHMQFGDFRDHRP